MSSYYLSNFSQKVFPKYNDGNNKYHILHMECVLFNSIKGINFAAVIRQKKTQKLHVPIHKSHVVISHYFWPGAKTIKDNKMKFSGFIYSHILVQRISN